MKYKGERYTFNQNKAFSASSEDFIEDYLRYSESQPVGIEMKIVRLTDLVARICDAQNIDLTKLINKYETEVKYTVDDTPDTD